MDQAREFKVSLYFRALNAVPARRGGWGWWVCDPSSGMVLAPDSAGPYCPGSNSTSTLR